MIVYIYFYTTAQRRSRVLPGPPYIFITEIIVHIKIDDSFKKRIVQV